MWERGKKKLQSILWRTTTIIFSKTLPENILVFREGQRFREVLPVEIPYMGFQINSFQAFFVYRQTSWVVFISWEALYQISIKVPENHKKIYFWTEKLRIATWFYWNVGNDSNSFACKKNVSLKHEGELTPWKYFLQYPLSFASVQLSFAFVEVEFRFISMYLGHHWFLPLCFASIAQLLFRFITIVSLDSFGFPW